MTEAAEHPTRVGHRLDDPILLRVIGGALGAIAKEMASTLRRTAYSQLCRESDDLGCGLCDATGRAIAESQTTPLMNGALSGMVKGLLQRLQNDIHDGDLILHNHPYKGAVHAPDVCIAIPIFENGDLVAFSTTSTHLTDLGGAYPGINVDVIDMWSEARIFDSVKLYERGELNAGLWRMIADNTRTPTLNMGDLEALISAARVGRRRYLSLLEKYGREVIGNAIEDWMDYSENMLRAEIAKVPDGEYTAPTGWLDDDGRNRGIPLRVCVKVIVDRSDLTIDLSGSNDEVETAFNAPFTGATCTAASFIARSIFLDEARVEEAIPQNDGFYRPIHVIAPYGSIFNPRFPRATGGRFCPVQRLADGVVLALNDAIPERTAAGSAAHTYFVSYAGWDEARQEYWAYLESNEGSYGARHGSDGLDSVDTLMANTRNTPIEELELRYPLRVVRYELREASPAPGQWRGGIGIVRENKVLVDTIISCEGDRNLDPPRGVRGGRDGLPGKITHVSANGDEQSMFSKFTAYRLKAGDILRLETPMGGGFGNPHARDPAAIERDVRDGYMTRDEASQAYGANATR